MTSSSPTVRILHNQSTPRIINAVAVQSVDICEAFDNLWCAAFFMRAHEIDLRTKMVQINYIRNHKREGGKPSVTWLFTGVDSGFDPMEFRRRFLPAQTTETSLKAACQLQPRSSRCELLKKIIFFRFKDDIHPSQRQSPSGSRGAYQRPTHLQGKIAQTSSRAHRQQTKI